MSTHVKVSDAVKDMLKAKKKELSLPSVDAVIQHLCASPPGSGDEGSASGSGDGDDGEPVKKRRVDVREPLYSLEILKERLGMVEFYTGLELSAVELLIRRFREVSMRLSVFPFFTFCRLRSALCVFALSSHALDAGDRVRRSGATREQRWPPKARFGGKSRHVPRSDEEKSDVQGAGLSVWVRGRVGETILRRARDYLSEAFCSAARVSSSARRTAQNVPAEGSGSLSGPFGHSGCHQLGAVHATELFS